MAISLLKSLQAMVRQIPDKETVTYAERTPAEDYAAGVNFEARHDPIASVDVNGLAKKWTTWHLYATNSQTVTPRRLGRITDASGRKWHVESALSSFGGLKHDCVCVLEV